MGDNRRIKLALAAGDGKGQFLGYRKVRAICQRVQRVIRRVDLYALAGEIFAKLHRDMWIIQFNRHRAQLRHSKDILRFGQMHPKPFGKSPFSGGKERHRRLVHRRARKGSTAPVRHIRLTRKGLIDGQPGLFGG